MKLETFFEKFDKLVDTPNGVEQLRKLILQIAVKGRLVDPSGNDEPVEEFLRRIWADKSDNRTELAGSEKARPFDLPDHWTWVVLAEVAEFSIGKTPPRGDSSYWYPEDNSWVSIADMKHYGTITETKEKVSALAAKEVFRERFAEPGSILMSFKLTIGKMARAGIRCFHNEAIISLLPPEPELAEYLFRFLPVFAALQTSNNAIKGSTLNKGLLTLLPIALPPLAEQKRIVAKVDELMALCDRLEAQLKDRDECQVALSRAALARFESDPTPENLEYLFHPSYRIPPADLRKAILTLAVRGKLVPQDPNDEDARVMINRAMENRQHTIKSKALRRKELVQNADPLDHALLPSSWCVERFANLVDPENTISYGVLVPGNDVPDGIPFVRAQDLSLSNHPPMPNKTIAPEIERPYARTRLTGGEILLCVVGSIGKLGVVPDSWAGANIARAVARIKPIPEVLRDYLLLVLQEQQVQNYFASTTRTLAQPTLNVGMIEQTPIPVPPLAEQRRVVAKVEELMALVDALESEIGAFCTTGINLLEAVVNEFTRMEAVSV